MCGFIVLVTRLATNSYFITINNVVLGLLKLFRLPLCGRSDLSLVSAHHVEAEHVAGAAVTISFNDDLGRERIFLPDAINFLNRWEIPISVIRLAMWIEFKQLLLDPIQRCRRIPIIVFSKWIGLLITLALWMDHWLRISYLVSIHRNINELGHFITFVFFTLGVFTISERFLVQLFEGFFWRSGSIIQFLFIDVDHEKHIDDVIPGYLSQRRGHESILHVNECNGLLLGESVWMFILAHQRQERHDLAQCRNILISIHLLRVGSLLLLFFSLHQQNWLLIRCQRWWPLVALDLLELVIEDFQVRDPIHPCHHVMHYYVWTFLAFLMKVFTFN